MMQLYLYEVKREKAENMTNIVQTYNAGCNHTPELVITKYLNGCTPDTVTMAFKWVNESIDFSYIIRQDMHMFEFESDDQILQIEINNDEVVEIYIKKGGE